MLGILAGRFGKEELKELAFGLGVDWDALPGDTLNGKAIGLIVWMEHRGRLAELRKAIVTARPGVSFSNKG